MWAKNAPCIGVLAALITPFRHAAIYAADTVWKWRLYRRVPFGHMVPNRTTRFVVRFLLMLWVRAEA